MEALPILLMRFFVLTVSLSFHEASHAWAADRLGDDTAKRLGRLSLNPLVHLDPIGSLMMLSGMPLGWAKPVPVNPNNLRNPRSAMPLVSFAGPLSNLILAFSACVLYYFVAPGLSSPGWFVLFENVILINFSLAIFNLLPIMPLDGSKIITAFMSDKVADRYEERMVRLGIFPLLAIVAIEYVSSGHGPLSLWFHFWKPLISPILGLFHVPYYFYPG
jgi:Zn-dependent protease